MTDQAEKLRRRIRNQVNNNAAKTIAVISGKGGVGKSNFSLNFAINLAKRNKKVLLFDLDIGMGNIELLAGINSEKSIVDFFVHHYPMDEIISIGPGGIFFIAGGQGLSKQVKLDQNRTTSFLRELEHLVYEYDYLIFDIGAGMSDEIVQFLAAIQQIFVVVTPELTSMMDAYSAIKYIVLNNHDCDIKLVGNRMNNNEEYRETMHKLTSAMQQFLNKKVKALGYLEENSLVGIAVRKQTPFSLLKPNATISKQLQEMVDILEGDLSTKSSSEDLKVFIHKLRSFLFRR